MSTRARSVGADADAAGQLRIYLNDHAAGAEGATALAQRSARANAGNALGDYLSGRFLPELAIDRDLLERVRHRFGARPNPVKRLVARAGELVGRAKLNGSLTGPTPLGRVLELEALLAGVTAKHTFWGTLSRLPSSDSGEPLDPDELDGAMTRAADQRRRLTELHRWATSEAFAAADEADAGDAAAGIDDGGDDS